MFKNTNISQAEKKLLKISRNKVHVIYRDRDIERAVLV